MKNKFLTFILVFATIIVFCLIIFVSDGFLLADNENLFVEDNNIVKKERVVDEFVSQKKCPITKEVVTVRGDSMGDLIPGGTDVEVLKGYYDCNDAVRNEVVIHTYSGNINPIIKAIRGVPGDSFYAKKEGDGWWYLYINGEKLKNSQGVYYITDEYGARMINVYSHDYKGIIPEDVYLLLGDKRRGSLDSRVFGLVNKSDFIGRVVISQ